MWCSSIIGASLSEPHTCGVNEPPVCVYICGDTTDKPGPRGRKLSNILYTAEKYLNFLK